MTILVFPCDNLITRLTLPIISEQYGSVVLATSNSNFNLDMLDNTILTLPWIKDVDFFTSFKKLVFEKSITEIFCPHPLVYEFLNKYKIEWNLPPIIPLSTQSILTRIFSLNSSLLELIDSILSKLVLSKREYIELRSLLFACENIYGETSVHKLAEIINISKNISKGDIVEIGVLFGKSGFFLSELSRIFGLGKVLLVDPWSEFDSIQNDEHNVLELLSKTWNWDIIFEMFLINMLPLTKNGNFSYLRQTSKEASRVYSKLRVISSTFFGSVEYSGQISLLHIDGNHDYSKVKIDIESWTPMLRPGAWILFDDYSWTAAIGVKEAVDEFLVKEQSKVDYYYLVDKCLFVKMKD